MDNDYDVSLQKIYNFRVIASATHARDKRREMLVFQLNNFLVR